MLPIITLQHIVHEQAIVHRYHDVFAVSILEICQIEFDDAGEYLCTATEGNCTVSATQPLIVEPGTMQLIVYLHFSCTNLVY